MQNAEELIHNCIQTLENKQRSQTQDNKAVCPSIIVMLGENTFNYIEYIKSTLEDNWSNSSYIQYLSIIIEEKNVKVLNLQENEKKVCEINSEKEVDDICLEVVRRLADILLETKDIFDSKEKLKIECVFDVVDKSFFEYYKLINRICGKLEIGVPVKKRMFLLLDQHHSNREAGNAKMPIEISQENLKKLIEAEKELIEKNAIYLLSNFLDNKDMLAYEETGENYHIIADIIFLGNSSSIGDTVDEFFSAGVRAISYASVGKPTKEIAQVVLKALLERIEQDEKDNENKKIEKDEKYQEKLTEIANRYFREAIIDELPKKEGFLYLPQKNKKIKKSNATINVSDIDNETNGVFSAFIKENFSASAERLINDIDNEVQFSEELKETIINQYDFSDLIAIYNRVDFRKIIEGMIDSIQCEYNIEGDNEFESKMYKFAIQEIEEKFSDFFRDKYKSILYKDKNNSLTNKAQGCKKIFSDLKGETLAELKKHPIKEKSIEESYSALIKEVSKVDCSGIFKLETSKEEMFSGILMIFDDLIQSKKEFNLDFEEEFEFREIGVEEKQKIINGKLIGSKDYKIRLNYANEKAIQEQKEYILVNTEASYDKYIHKEKKRIHVDRKDCIEQLIIHKLPDDIDNLSLIV